MCVVTITECDVKDNLFINRFINIDIYESIFILHNKHFLTEKNTFIETTRQKFHHWATGKPVKAGIFNA